MTPIKILGIGDSITAERPANVGKVYYQQIDDNIRTLFPEYDWGGYTKDFNVAPNGIVNHGHGGWATGKPRPGPVAGFVERWQKEALDEKANIVTIMLGTNDHNIYDYTLGGTTPAVTLEEYKNNLRSMIDQLRSVNNGSAINGGVAQIILISPPPVKSKLVPNTTAQTDNTRLATYAQAVKEISVEKKTYFVDNYNHFWNLVGQDENVFVSKYAPDGIHLIQAGHDILYDLVIDEITKVINDIKIVGPSEKTISKLQFVQNVKGEIVFLKSVRKEEGLLIKNRPIGRI